jgi:hypothetical protein
MNFSRNIQKTKERNNSSIEKSIAEYEFQLRASSKAEPTNSPQYAIKGKKQRID